MFTGMASIAPTSSQGSLTVENLVKHKEANLSGEMHLAAEGTGGSGSGA